MTNSKLPEGWRWARLGDVCSMGSGGTPKRGNAAYFGGSIPWAMIGDLNDSVVTTTKETITDAGLRNSSAKLVPAGTLLIAMYGSVGKLGVAGIDLTTNQAIAHIRPDPVLDRQWLFYRLRVDRERLVMAGSGITQNNISQAVLKQWAIPLPPIAEQRRIVAHLEEQLATADRARAAAAAQLAAIEAMPQALLREIFPRSPASPLQRGWRWVKLGDVCVEDRSAITQADADYAHMPYLGLEHIESVTGRILVNEDTARLAQSKSNNFKFTPEHVLYGKLRPYLNKVALPDFAGRCTTEIIPLKPTLADRAWLVHLLRCDALVDHAMRGKTGSRMPRASMRDLMAFSVALPPLSEQRRIVARLEQQTTAIDRARAAAQSQLDAINALPAAVLQLAFTP